MLFENKFQCFNNFFAFITYYIDKQKIIIVKFNNFFSKKRYLCLNFVRLSKNNLFEFLSPFENLSENFNFFYPSN